jgi:molybdopterin molybdotransferase
MQEARTGAALARPAAVDVNRATANSSRMISFDEALAIVGNAAQPLGTETVPLRDAAGRVLASAVVAAIDSPRADVSAMDGYAVREADLASLPVRLRVIGESFPGNAWQGTVATGSCVRIFTGAPVPAGADRIIIQELVSRDGDVARIDSRPTDATWIRQRGADFCAGDTLLNGSRCIDAAALVAIAGADVADVEVAQRPRIALLATGDELVDPGQAGQSDLNVPDSVSPALVAFVDQWGGAMVMQRRLRDHLASMTDAAAEAVEAADLVVVTGGASVGERDFANAMFEPLELLFSKVAIRPGKPAWFGRAGKTLVLGLPGNPTSALVTARLLLAPLLASMQGRALDDALPWEPTRLATGIPACDRRETFHRATLSAGEATVLPFQESHAQKTLADAQVLVRQAAGSPALAAGETVQALRL